MNSASEANHKTIYLFKAKTQEAYQIKILAELLTNNLKTGCFEVTETGVTLRMMDHHRKTLIDLNLPAENFGLYRFTAEEKMYLGLNLTHFHKMLKSIKKKDSLQLYIDAAAPRDLAIKAIPKENTRIMTSFVKIQTIQNLDVDVPTGYGRNVIVSSGEFQKMLKDMMNIGQTIQVTAQDFHIKFTCTAGGVYHRQVEFGEQENDDDSTEPKGQFYDQEFATEQLARITKIAGLGSTMQIYPADNLPLLFRSNVGNLGKINIYIKSKAQIEQENVSAESDSE